MISCVVVSDGRVTRIVYDDTHYWLLGSWCVSSHTNLTRPRSLCLNIHFETKKQSQKS